MGNDFRDVKIKINNKEMTVKMQIGCSFENNNNIYRLGNDGKLSVFDKKTQAWSAKSEITMTNYQFSVFKAVANNTKEKINGKQTNDIVLSQADINFATEKLYGQKQLTSDLSEFLSGTYKATDVKAYKNNNAFSAYITNGNKATSGTLIFKYGTDKDAVTISRLVIDKNNQAAKGADNSKANTQANASANTQAPTKTKPTTVSGNNQSQKKQTTATPNTKAQTTSKPKTVATVLPMFAVTAQNNTTTTTVPNFLNSIPEPFSTSIDFSEKIKKESDAVRDVDIIVSNKEKTEPVNNKASKVVAAKSTEFSELPKLYERNLKTLAQKMKISEQQLSKYIADAAKKTGYSEYFIAHLVSVEDYEPVPRNIGDGTLTAGFGHTALKDKKVKHVKNVTPSMAFDWLASDIRDFEKIVKNIPMEDNSKEKIGDYWQNAPLSLREAMLDFAFNRDVNKLKTDEYRTFRANLKAGKKNIAACAVSLRQNFDRMNYKQKLNSKFTTGLMKRNCYRFLLAIRDFERKDKDAAKRRFENSNHYYSETLKLLKAKGAKNALAIDLLIKDWNNS